MQAANGVMEQPESDDTIELSDAERWAGLSTRIVSAVVLAAIALGCIYEGGMLFASFIMLAAMVMKKEWDALVPAQAIKLRVFGYIYIILPCAAFLWLRSLQGAGPGAVLAVVAIVSATDIGAYFTGRRFGRHKLSPLISPSKTWEGLAGGIIAAALAAVLMSPYVPVPHSPGGALATGMLLAVLAQAGDLFESLTKRRAGVKDSGTLLPGHGGLLDRFDGYMFATPVFALLLHFALET
jgi:phosphatidate cytidylyltransferase